MYRGRFRVHLSWRLSNGSEDADVDVRHGGGVGLVRDGGCPNAVGPSGVGGRLLDLRPAELRRVVFAVGSGQLRGQQLLPDRERPASFAGQLPVRWRGHRR